MTGKCDGLENIELREQVAEISRALQNLSKNDKSINHLVVFEGNSLRSAGNHWSISHDSSATPETSVSDSQRQPEVGSISLIRGPIHLFLQRVDRGIQGGKLTLNTIAPH